MKIAIGNVGSTSLKTKIIDIRDNGRVLYLGEANLDRIKTPGSSTFAHAAGSREKEKETVDIHGFEQGLDLILSWYLEKGVISRIEEIEAVGFKTVMAARDRGACILTDEVIAEMKSFAFVAPAHNLPYIETIELFRQHLPGVPLVGVFEPSFHYQIPEYRRITGLPLGLEREYNLGQFGFHGSTGRYGLERVKQLHSARLAEQGLSLREPLKCIYNHFGGSCSTHAISGDTCVATTMRFSLQSGHFQSTRVGDLDPYAVLYLMDERGMNPHEMHNLLSSQSGLLGMAGIGSGEMSDIIKAAEAGNADAALTVDAFVDRARQYIGAYSAVLEGLDVLVFAGGIGENGTDIRTKICRGLGYLGIELDDEKNGTLGSNEGLISSDSSRVQVYVVRTNEEIVVAQFTKKVVESGRDLTPEEMQFRLPEA